MPLVYKGKSGCVSTLIKEQLSQETSAADGVETSGTIRDGGEFRNQLSDYQLLKENSLEMSLI
jgi:hypothetical protein